MQKSWLEVWGAIGYLHSLKVLTRYLLIKKDKTVTLQWRNLEDTLTKLWKLTSIVIGHIKTWHEFSITFVMFLPKINNPNFIIRKHQTIQK
jgi:hypothetical protein